MVSLAAAIARRRIYYPRPIPSLPDILMIDVPRCFAVRRALRHFHPILVESVEEQSEIDAFLAEERGAQVSPNLLDERLSTLSREDLTIAHYGSSQSGWPFVQLCQWPAEFAAMASGKDRKFARGVYTFELFHDRERLEEASTALLASLDRQHALKVQIVFPDWSVDPTAPPH